MYGKKKKKLKSNWKRWPGRYFVRLFTLNSTLFRELSSLHVWTKKDKGIAPVQFQILSIERTTSLIPKRNSVVAFWTDDNLPVILFDYCLLLEREKRHSIWVKTEVVRRLSTKHDIAIGRSGTIRQRSQSECTLWSKVWISGFSRWVFRAYWRPDAEPVGVLLSVSANNTLSLCLRDRESYVTRKCTQDGVRGAQRSGKPHLGRSY